MVDNRYRAKIIVVRESAEHSIIYLILLTEGDENRERAEQSVIFSQLAVVKLGKLK